jgi:hypothetical protein
MRWPSQIYRKAPFSSPSIFRQEQNRGSYGAAAVAETTELLRILAETTNPSGHALPGVLRRSAALRYCLCPSFSSIAPFCLCSVWDCSWRRRWAHDQEDLTRFGVSKSWGNSSTSTTRWFGLVFEVDYGWFMLHAMTRLSHAHAYDHVIWYSRI